MSIWKGSTGKIVKNATGKVVSCADCPCDVVYDCSLCIGNFSSWTVNFGAGGWTNNNCDSCELISGEFVVNQRLTDCYYKYSEELGNCSLFIFVELWFDANISSYVLRVTVDFEAAERAVFDYLFDLDNLPDCVDEPLTLTKTIDVITANGQCGGALPATITVTGNP